MSQNLCCGDLPTKGQRKVSAKPPSNGAWLESQCRPLFVQVRLNGLNSISAKFVSTLLKSAKSCLVRDGNDHEIVGVKVPRFGGLGISHSKLESCMYGLGHLCARSQVGSDCNVQAVGMYLTVRHRDQTLLLPNRCPQVGHFNFFKVLDWVVITHARPCLWPLTRPAMAYRFIVASETPASSDACLIVSIFSNRLFRTHALLIPLLPKRIGVHVLAGLKRPSSDFTALLDPVEELTGGITNWHQAAKNSLTSSWTVAW